MVCISKVSPSFSCVWGWHDTELDYGLVSGMIRLDSVHDCESDKNRCYKSGAKIAAGCSIISHNISAITSYLVVCNIADVQPTVMVLRTIGLPSGILKLYTS